VDIASSNLELVPVCPELEAGMSVPRPAIDLVMGETGLRVVDRVADLDHTEALTSVALAHAHSARESQADGLVLKAKSPSCGVGTAPRIHGKTGEVIGTGDGVLAGELRRVLGDVPWIDETGLSCIPTRNRFVLGVFAGFMRRGGGMDATVDPDHRLSTILCQFSRHTPSGPAGDIEPSWSKDQREMARMSDEEISDIATQLLGRHQMIGA